MDEDLNGLAAFRDCLMNISSPITTVDLMYNRIGERGALILADALEGNSRIQEFLVDLTLPMPIFEKVFRKAGGKKKGKKGGGKKKKK